MRQNYVPARLFVGLSLPENIKQYLRININMAPLVNNLHLTMRFIGETTDAHLFLGALENICAPRFELKISGIRMFRKEILAATVETSLALEFLKAETDRVLLAAGLPLENRKFRPHITLCRSKKMSGILSMTDSAKLKSPPQWQVDNFCMFQSLLRPGGAEHKLLRRYPLKDGI